MYIINSEPSKERMLQRKSAFRIKNRSPVDHNSSISKRPPAPLPRESLDSAMDDQQKDLHGTTEHYTKQSPRETAVDTTLEQMYDTVQVCQPASSKFKSNEHAFSRLLIISTKKHLQTLLKMLSQLCNI